MTMVRYCVSRFQGSSIVSSLNLNYFRDVFVRRFYHELCRLPACESSYIIIIKAQTSQRC